MGKTDRQMLLELRYGKSIRELIEDTLQQYQGQLHCATRTAVQLDVSPSTLRLWTERLGIDVRGYAAAERGEAQD